MREEFKNQMTTGGGGATIARSASRQSATLFAVQHTLMQRIQRGGASAGRHIRGPLDRVRFSFNIREREIKVMFARRLVVIIMLVAFACNLSALAAARPASFASEGQAFT